MAGRLITAAAAFVPLAYAFYDTYPIIAWSSSSSSALESLPSNLPTGVDIPLLLGSILNQDGICDHDAVVLIEQPGLHASDLRTISPHSKLNKILSSSLSTRQFPYVNAHGHSVALRSFGDELASYCDSKLLSYSLGDKDVALESGAKHVVCVNMPGLHSEGRDRKYAMKKHESHLGDELSYIASTFPNHLVIIAGSPSRHDITPRQMFEHGSVGSVFANTTLPEGGILKRYQILTPALITGFLVTFFILVPILLFGIKALASIQSPVRMDAPKGFSAQEKKNQ